MKENSNIPRVWFVSDTHFWHERIISICKRPFKTNDEMTIKLIQNWNSVVGKNDVVWHLGDFGFFGKKDCEKVRNTLNKLHGIKYLLLGNHDRHVSDNLKFWYDLGFSKVWDKPFLFMDNYILSHEPILTKNGIDLSYSPNLKNIHGHTHNSWDEFQLKSKEEQQAMIRDNPKFIPVPDITKHTYNVSVEVNMYTPILFETIIKRMQDV